jgi:hypothetical protein
VRDDGLRLEGLALLVRIVTRAGPTLSTPLAGEVRPLTEKYPWLATVETWEPHPPNSIRCKVCKGEGRDPNHWKNACGECQGTGRVKPAKEP